MPPPHELRLSAQLEQHAPGVEDAWASGWTAVSARDAVDMHKRGTFTASWQLAIDVPSYPPIRAALNQRVAAARSATYAIEGPSRAPGRFETEGAQRMQSLVEDIERSTFKDLAMMGLSVWQHPVNVNPVTLRHEVTSLERWPLAAVEYSSWRDEKAGYFAITKTGERIRLPKPGTTDGHWTVVGEGDQPHLDGAVTALDTSFVAGQRARMAFSKLTDTMGRASVVAELPGVGPGGEGVSIATTSEEGKSMLIAAKALGTTQTAVAHPKGGKFYPFEVTTQTGQLAPQLTDQEARMVAWALLGHDATISRGENVYTDPTAQAVPEDLTRETVKNFTGAVNAILAMLALVNVGAEVEPPKLVGTLPDSDQDARLKASDERAARRAQRHALLMAAIEAERKLGEVTQTRVNELAKAFDVEPAPRLVEPLAPAAPAAPPAPAVEALPSRVP